LLLAAAKETAMRIHPLVLSILVAAASPACDKSSASNANDKPDKSEKGKTKQDKSDDDDDDSTKKGKGGADGIDSAQDAMVAKKTAKDCTFEKMCDFDGRLVEAKWTGKLADDGAVFRVRNLVSRKVTWDDVGVWYYDDAGKRLQIKRDSDTFEKSWCSGGCISLDPGETKEVSLGFEKKYVPKGAKSIEAEVVGVGYEDKKDATQTVYFENDGMAPDDRPLGGVKDGGKKKDSDG
jgi:hypothetical protein